MQGLLKIEELKPDDFWHSFKFPCWSLKCQENIYIFSIQSFSWFEVHAKFNPYMQYSQSYDNLPVLAFTPKGMVVVILV